MCSLSCPEEHGKKDRSGRRRAFALQIEGLERLQKSVLHGKKGGCRAGGRARLDVDALDRTYADDLMVTAPIGICVDKPAVMSEIRQAAEKAIIGRYDKDDLKVRAFGDTAVSSYRMTAWATFEGKEIKRQLCITNVWMKRNGHWQIDAAVDVSAPEHAVKP